MLKLPIYLLVGEKLVSAEETPGGGMALRGWDFIQRKMTREAADWDDVMSTSADAVEITKEAFDQRLAELQAS
jgi:hypothetical protein